MTTSIQLTLTPAEAEVKAKRWYAQRTDMNCSWDDLSESRRDLILSVAAIVKTDDLCMAPKCGGNCLRCFV